MRFQKYPVTCGRGLKLGQNSKYFLVESNKELGLPQRESIFRCMRPREHFKTKFLAVVPMFGHSCSAS